MKQFLYGVLAFILASIVGYLFTALFTGHLSAIYWSSEAKTYGASSTLIIGLICAAIISVEIDFEP